MFSIPKWQAKNEHFCAVLNNCKAYWCSPRHKPSKKNGIAQSLASQYGWLIATKQYSLAHLGTNAQWIATVTVTQIEKKNIQAAAAGTTTTTKYIQAFGEATAKATTSEHTTLYPSQNKREKSSYSRSSSNSNITYTRSVGKTISRTTMEEKYHIENRRNNKDFAERHPISLAIYSIFNSKYFDRDQKGSRRHTHTDTCAGRMRWRWRKSVRERERKEVRGGKKCERGRKRERDSVRQHLCLC